MDGGRFGAAVLLASVLAVLSAGCGGGGGRSQALREATQACRDYVSVNGLTGPAALKQYLQAEAAAKSAAAHDGKWRGFAANFKTFVEFNDSLVNGNVNVNDSTTTAPGVAAGRAVALECGRLGVHS